MIARPCLRSQRRVQDDGSFSKSIDLVAHAKRTGAVITNAMVQELSDLIPEMTSLNISGCDNVTDIGLWCVQPLERQYDPGCYLRLHTCLWSHLCSLTHWHAEPPFNRTMAT